MKKLHGLNGCDTSRVGRLDQPGPWHVCLAMLKGWLAIQAKYGSPGHLLRPCFCNNAALPTLSMAKTREGGNHWIEKFMPVKEL